MLDYLKGFLDNGHNVPVRVFFNTIGAVGVEGIVTGADATGIVLRVKNIDGSFRNQLIPFAAIISMTSIKDVEL